MGACTCSNRWLPRTVDDEEGGITLQLVAAFEDVVFVCGYEGAEIGACRALVASRSPVLKSMLLTSGMAESGETRIYFPDIEFDCMRICLEFFYTDSVENTSWSSALLAMKVVKAAMFFLLARLEGLALSYIDNTTISAEKKDAKWCEGLIPSYNLGIQLYPAHISSKDQNDNASELCNLRSFLDTFRRHAKSKIAGCSNEQLFSGCKHERLFYECISDQALAHFIEGSPVDTNPLSQYFSFLHMVRWSASRLLMADPSIDEEELEDMLNKCFPRCPQVMGNMLSSCTDIQSLDDANVSRLMKLIADPLVHCLQIIPLNIAEIPTHVLCRFMEPLDVIPSSTLLRAYRCQAFDKPDLQWEQPCYGNSYKVDPGNRKVICSKGQGLKGFAKCSIQLNATSHAFFDWEIIILSACKEMKVGFCLCKPSFKASNRTLQVLGANPGTWALCASGSLRHTNFSSETCSSQYADAFQDKKVTIQVHLNLASRSCSFSIDGKDAGLAWSDLPICGETTVCPAISLGKRGIAKVQMVHQSWMDPPTNKRLRIAN